MEDESQHFINMMKDKAMEYDPCDAINIDQSQSCIHITQSEHKMIRKNTINVCASTIDTKRYTVAVTLNASRKCFHPCSFSMVQCMDKVQITNLELIHIDIILVVRRKQGYIRQ